MSRPDKKTAQPPSHRLDRKKKTLAAMFALYCRNLHKSKKALCADCLPVLSYALKKLEKCRLQENKLVCVNCPVHCYEPRMRESIRSIMRYAGPRMMVSHPALALLHLIDGWIHKSTVKS